jgi:hypothetical protein
MNSKPFSKMSDAIPRGPVCDNTLKRRLGWPCSDPTAGRDDDVHDRRKERWDPPRKVPSPKKFDGRRSRRNQQHPSIRGREMSLGLNPSCVWPARHHTSAFAH